MPQLGLSLWPHGSHGGLSSRKRLRAQAERLLSQGGWRGLGERRMACRRRLWSAVVLHGKGSLESEETRGTCGSGPTFVATPTAPQGSPKRTTVPAAPRSGHPVSLTSLPASPRELRSTGSSASGASSCPAHGGASTLGTGSRNSFPRNTSHTGGPDGGGGAGCHLLSAIASSATGSSSVKTPGLQGDRPPSAPVCSPVPPFLVH